MTEKLHNEVIIAQPKPFFYVGIVAGLCENHDDIVIMAKDKNKDVMDKVIKLLRNLGCFEFYEERERKLMTDQFGNQFHSHVVKIEKIGVLRSD